MLKPGPAKKMTVYVGEDAHHRGEPLYLSVLNYLFKRGVAGATVTKGVAGFGAHHQMHTARILEISGNLPIKIEFVEQASTIDELLPTLTDLLAGAGLIEMHDTTVVVTPTSPDTGRH